VEDIKIIELFFNRDETAIQELSNKYSGYCYKIIYVFLTIFLYLLKCPQSLIL
jgi:RNA polymerase sigma-70 factor (ECF subfamily)